MSVVSPMPITPARQLETPARKRRQLQPLESDETPAKLAYPSTRNEAPPAADKSAAKEMHWLDKATQLLDADEHSVLRLLFNGVEQVLQLHSRRGKPGALKQVRLDVENHTHRALTEERLLRILGLAGNMFEVRWGQDGGDVEIYQLDPNGHIRAPGVEQFSERAKRFNEAIAAAADAGGAIPEATLPTAPAPPPSVGYLVDGRPVAPATEIPAISAAPMQQASKTLTSVERKQALRNRVVARAALRESTVNRATVEVRRQLHLIHDALVVSQVVVQLFGKNAFSAAGLGGSVNGNGVTGLFTQRSQALHPVWTSESEVVKAMSSGAGPAARNRLPPSATKAALGRVTRHGEGWITVETNKWNPGAKYIKRLPGGHPLQVTKKLESEKNRWQLFSLDLGGGGDLAESAAKKVLDEMEAQTVLGEQGIHAAEHTAAASDRSASSKLTKEEHFESSLSEGATEVVSASSSTAPVEQVSASSSTAPVEVLRTPTRPPSRPTTMALTPELQADVAIVDLELTDTVEQKEDDIVAIADTSAGSDAVVSEFFTAAEVSSTQSSVKRKRCQEEPNQLLQSQKRSKQDFSALSVSALRDALRAKGLKMSGNKADLIARLKTK